MLILLPLSFSFTQKGIEFPKFLQTAVVVGLSVAAGHRSSYPRATRLFQSRRWAHPVIGSAEGGRLQPPAGQRQRAWRGWAQPGWCEAGTEAAGKMRRGSGDLPPVATVQDGAGASGTTWPPWLSSGCKGIGR
uniref:Uncharacterized protein n=1 Tax=Oryza barthii TaxID=65489 RepID=A0A0D3HST0_9ORYZ